MPADRNVLAHRDVKSRATVGFNQLGPLIKTPFLVIPYVISICMCGFLIWHYRVCTQHLQNIICFQVEAPKSIKKSSMQSGKKPGFWRQIHPCYLCDSIHEATYFPFFEFRCFIWKMDLIHKEQRVDICEKLIKQRYSMHKLLLDYHIMVDFFFIDILGEHQRYMTI